MNEALASQPEKVNQSPYDQGWLFKLEVNDSNELIELMDAATYSNEASK